MWYINISVITMIIGFVVFVIIPLIAHAYTASIKFIYDTKVVENKLIDLYDKLGFSVYNKDYIDSMPVYFFMILVGPFLWPIVIPIAIYIGVLYLIRRKIRRDRQKQSTESNKEGTTNHL